MKTNGLGERLNVDTLARLTIGLLKGWKVGKLNLEQVDGGGGDGKGRASVEGILA
jgi:hypothetical protein